MNQLPDDIDLDNLPDGMMALRTTWFPHRNGILLVKNPRYFQALWIGITYPLGELPYLLWYMSIRPMIGAVINPIAYILKMLIYGLMGNIVGVKMPKGARLASPDEEDEE
jgi:hypothetical protein